MVTTPSLGTASGQITVGDATNQWDSSDTFTGGAGTGDVLLLGDDSQTIVDLDFTNVTLIEKLTQVMALIV